MVHPIPNTENYQYHQNFINKTSKNYQSPENNATFRFPIKSNHLNDKKQPSKMQFLKYQSLQALKPRINTTIRQNKIKANSRFLVCKSLICFTIDKINPYPRSINTFKVNQTLNNTTKLHQWFDNEKNELYLIRWPGYFPGNLSRSISNTRKSIIRPERHQRGQWPFSFGLKPENIPVR